MATTQDDRIADLQRAIAELRQERDAALAQKVALAEVLDVINRFPGDPGPVFEAILEKAHALCGAALGSMTTYDGAHFHVVATHGYPDKLVTLMRQPRRTGPEQQSALRGERYFHEPDVRTLDDGSMDEVARTNLDLTGLRTYLAVPLRKDGNLLGIISAGRQEVRPFAESEITLLEGFAAQAVIAMENARLLGELRQRTADLQESLEYQTATSDVLKVISRSAFDLKPVLDTLVETAARLCNADMANLVRREGELYRVVADFGYTPEYGAWLRAVEPYRPERRSVGSRAALEGRVVHVHDIAADPNYPTGPITLGKQRTSLGVPLLREGDVIGFIVLARQRVEPFTDRQIELVSIFADQAVIAIENTRLITEQREALEQQTATAEVLQVINASPGNLVPVFDALLERALRLCESSFGILCTFDGEFYHVVAMRDVAPGYADLIRAPVRAVPGMSAYDLVLGKDVVHVVDITTDARYDLANPLRRALADQSGGRTVIWIALRRDGALVGMINIYRREVRPYSDQHIALLQNFADQAVIAIENTRLITEQREALEQQTATAEVLQVINTSPGNLAPVFDAMLEKAMRLCGAAFGSLYTYDGERFHSAAQRGVPPAYAAFRAENPPLPTQGGGPATLLETRRPLQVLDIRAHESYGPDYPGVQAMVELGGVRTVLSVPLLKDETFFGYISIFRKEVRAFTDKEIALVQNFAAQAVIAMENARLITEQQEALEQQTATAEVLQVINASPGNLTPVFEAILEKAHDLCDIAYGDLQLYDGEHLHSVAQRGLSVEFADRLRQGYRASDSPASRPLLAGGRFTHITDAAAVDFMVFRSAVRPDGIRTVLFVPLRKDGSLLGMIASARKEVRPFTEKEISLLENFAAQAVIAMENARLITEQREALEQQTATAEVLAVINASPGDLAPVFEAILEKAMHLCDAAFGTLALYEDGHESIRAVAMHNLPDALVELFRDKQRILPDNSFGRMARGESPIHIIDAAADGAGLVASPMRRAAVEIGGAHTALWVALRKGQQVLGASSRGDV